MVYMQLVGSGGEPLGTLNAGADEIIVEAEQHATAICRSGDVSH